MERHAKRAAALVRHSLALGAPLPQPSAQTGQASGSRMRLFRIVTMRGDLLVGLTEAELATLGSGPGVERIARRIANFGQITAWRYSTGPGTDGGLALVTHGQVAVLRQDALMVEPCAPRLPVLSPSG